MVLKGCFYVGASLCRLCVSSVFGVRAGFGIDASHVFLQGVLAFIPFIANVVGFVVFRSCVGCEVGLLLYSVSVSVL